LEKVRQKYLRSSFVIIHIKFFKAERS
jgi:hypothetical protein